VKGKGRKREGKEGIGEGPAPPNISAQNRT